MRRLILTLCALCVCSFPAKSFSQQQDSITFSADYGPKSEELLDYYRFAGIDYFTMKATGLGVTKKKFTIIAKEYWNGKVTKTVTCVDDIGGSKIKGDTNTLQFTVMAGRGGKDSAKFMFGFPRFYSYRYFKTTKGDYSLRDPFNGKEITYSSKANVMLLVYSLPYQDPEYPGWSSYCELSSTGVPPSEWGKKYGIKHYITFEIQLH